jgi:hypothetical protein
MTQPTFPFGTVKLTLPLGYRTIDCASTETDIPALKELIGEFLSVEFAVGQTSNVTARVTITRRWKGALYDMGTYEGRANSTHLTRNGISIHIINIQYEGVTIALIKAL